MSSDGSKTIQRPKRGESEDDLLKFQEQFLASKQTSSVTVVNKAGEKRKTDEQGDRDVVQLTERKEKMVVGIGNGCAGQSLISQTVVGIPDAPPPVDSVPPVKKSKFRAAREGHARSQDGHARSEGGQARSRADKSRVDQELGDTEELMDSQDTHMAAVLTRIIERDTKRAQFNLPRPTSQAFPSVHHLHDHKQATAPAPKKSLFAQQFAQAPEEFGVQRPADVLAEIPDSQANMGDDEQMGIVDGSGLSATFGCSELHKIHEETAEKMAALTDEEKLAEQQKLLQILDPKLVEFLKSKPQQKLMGDKSSPSTYVGEITGGHPKQKETKTQSRAVQEVPIPVSKAWSHMDKVEYDKLEWMKDLPAPSTDNNKTGQQARFDFKGNLLAADADVPVNVGLHHHGDEPERAGYTLQELFQLARSSNVQQRALALHTLARVIKQAREGALAELVQSPILPSLLDAGVIFLLRWSLDDSVPAVVIATVAALNALLVNQADEAALDKVFHWYQGHRVACQAPSKQENIGIKLPDVADERAEETDADVAKQDLVLALVSRMSLLVRLRYILEVVRPDAPTVIGVLQILIRLARHSSQAAYEVFNTKGLLDLIMKEFVPLAWSGVAAGSQPLSVVYGVPLSTAMRLMRTLCQAGTNMAAILVTRYQLQDRLIRYLATDAKLLELPDSEAHSLQIESLNVWKTCLSYNLADTVFLELYPVLLDKLTAGQGILDRPQWEQTLLTALVGTLEVTICVATQQHVHQVFKHSQDGGDIEMERSESVAMAMINWSHVAGLFQPIKLLLQALLGEIAANYQIKKHNLQLVAACLNFVTTYCMRHQTQCSGGGDTIKLLEEMEEIYAMCVRHWNSYGFTTIRSNISKHSNLLQAEGRNLECSSCLPDYGNSSVDEDKFLPVASTHTPFNFLSAFCRLMYHFCKIHKGLCSKESPVKPGTVTSCTDIRTYLRKVAGSRPYALWTNYFSKFENHLLYYILKLAALQGDDGSQDADTLSMLHSVALNLLTMLQHGDEHLVHDLLSTVVYQPLFWKLDREVMTSSQMSELSLTEGSTVHLHSATTEEVRFTSSQLCQEACTNLNSIRATYLASLGHCEKQVHLSRSHFLQNTMATESCFTSSIGEGLMPHDWMFMPLIELYNTFASVGAEKQDLLSSTQVGRVCDVLRWIYLLEVHRPAMMQRVSVTLRVTRLMCTFLTGNDMFLNASIQRHLAALLRHYSQSSLLDKLDFQEEIPGLTSFYDLYMSLLQQFEAVSFGDSLFGCYLLLPLQQKHDIQYRRAVWTEYTGILRTLTVPVTELLVPIERYLVPEETDVEMLRLFYQSLMGASLRPAWSPVLYLIAVHHVNRFLNTRDGAHQKMKAAMMGHVLGCKHEELKQHLLYYKTANVSQRFGMELYQILPQSRQLFIDSLQHKSTQS